MGHNGVRGRAVGHLGIDPLAAGTGRRIAAVSAPAGLAAFAVDVHLY